jgi:hypothetical protein
LKAEPSVESRNIVEANIFEEVAVVLILPTVAETNALTEEDPVLEEIESDKTPEAKAFETEANELVFVVEFLLNGFNLNERVSPPTATVSAVAANTVAGTIVVTSPSTETVVVALPIESEELID